MPKRTGVNQGPLTFGMATPIFSAAFAAWPPTPIATVTTAATPSLRKTPYRLFIIPLQLPNIRRISASRSATSAAEALVQRNREDQRKADQHHLRVGRHIHEV